MANDDIQRTIYKLEIDDSAYIAGVDKLSASTKKLTTEQEKTNAVLADNEQALKDNAAMIEANRKALESYAGTDQRTRQQLTANLQKSIVQQQILNKEIAISIEQYEEAAVASQNFSNISASASRLQAGTTGGKIPTSAPVGIINVAPVTQYADELERLTGTLAQNQELQGIYQSELAATNAEMEALDVSSANYQADLAVLTNRAAVLKAEMVSLGSTMKNQVIIENSAAGSLDALNARLALLTAEYGRLSAVAQTSPIGNVIKGEIQSLNTAVIAQQSGLKQVETQTQTSMAAITAPVRSTFGFLRRLAFVLPGIGIAGLFGIAFQGFQALIDMISKGTTGLTAFEEAQKGVNDSLKAGENAYVKASSEVSMLRNDIDLAKQGFISKSAVVKEYNESIGKTTGSVKDLAEAEQGLIDNADNYIKFTLYKAAANFALGEAAKKAFEIEQNALNRTNADNIDIRREAFKNATKEQINDFNKLNEFYNLAFLAHDTSTMADLDARRTKIFNQFAESNVDVGLKNSQTLLEKIAKDFQQKYDEISKGFKITPSGDKAKKAIENEFLQRKAALDEKLAELTRKESDNESKVRVEYAAKLVKEQLEIDKLLKEKKLTGPQAEILKAENVQINAVELDKALKDFRKKVTDAREKLNEELRVLQEKATQDSLNLIQDEFDRRAKLIDFNEQKETGDAKEAQNKRGEALNLQRSLIGEKAYYEALAVLINAGEQEDLNIIQKYADERQVLAADIFKKTLDQYKQAIDQTDLLRDETAAEDVRKVSDKYLAGKITFEKFTKDIEDIQEKADARKRNADLKVQRDELSILDQHIDTVKDHTSQEYKDLIKARDELRKQIAEGEKADATQDVKDKKSKVDERAAKITGYADAIGQLTESVIQFWQIANEVESKALDRSIALQEKRVDQARVIAARGNAEYLKAEEDRLSELNVKRENAARKQLGIDAALQASQILVGITGAIAKISTGIGVAETIGEIAVIIGALATGYGLVKSLQGNQPKLFRGTKNVSGDGHPDGIDTIPAWLNKGEAVIPTDKNRAYHPTVSAIYDGTVPAESLNNFVRTYHRVKGVPVPNYDRIKDAAGLQVGYDGKMAGLLEENNDLQRQTLRAMKSMAVSATIDRDGVAIMVNQHIEQLSRDKRL